ncbi:unnamed protein product, partial [Rotaria magnacalcarata]
MTTVTSGNSLNNNRSSNNASPASFNLAEEPTPLIASPPLSASLSSSSSLTSSRDRCRRCQQLVYCTERIGPVKDA